MTLNQKQVAAWIAVAALAAGVVASLLLAVTSTDERYLDRSGDEVDLSAIWTAANFFIKNDALVNALFGSFFAILSVALTYVAKFYTRKREIAVIAGLCLLGVAFAAIALAMMSAEETLDNFQLYGRYDDTSQAATKLLGFFGGLIGWFVGFLAAALGISLMRKDGAFRAAEQADEPPPAAAAEQG